MVAKQEKNIRPNYHVSAATHFDNVIAAIKGFVIGFIILYLFYKILILSIVGGAIFGFVYIFINQKNMIEKRKFYLRSQFFDLLEAMSVAMRAGNPPIKALQSAKKDLSMIYEPSKDIMIELDIIIGNFENAILLSRSFRDLAERTGLEDIQTFASIYETIEGKSSRADEIVREVQEIIADKAEVEIEMETLMTASKSEMTVMFMMPLVLLLLMNFTGGGLLDGIYATTLGRITATVCLIVYIACYFLGQSLSKIEV